MSDVILYEPKSQARRTQHIVDEPARPTERRSVSFRDGPDPSKKNFFYLTRLSSLRVSLQTAFTIRIYLRLSCGTGAPRNRSGVHPGKADSETLAGRVAFRRRQMWKEESEEAPPQAAVWVAAIHPLRITVEDNLTRSMHTGSPLRD